MQSRPCWTNEKWYVELNRFHIDYKPRTTIKGQVLVDFIAKFHDDIVAEPATPTPLTGGQDPANSSLETNMNNHM